MITSINSIEIFIERVSVIPPLLIIFCLKWLIHTRPKWSPKFISAVIFFFTLLFKSIVWVRLGSFNIAYTFVTKKKYDHKLFSLVSDIPKITIDINFVTCKYVVNILWDKVTSTLLVQTKKKINFDQLIS